MLYYITHFAKGLSKLSPVQALPRDGPPKRHDSGIILGLHRGHIGIMEKKTETTISVLGVTLG